MARAAATRVLELLAESVAAGVPGPSIGVPGPSIGAYNLVMTSHARHGDVEETEALFAQILAQVVSTPASNGTANGDAPLSRAVVPDATTCSCVVNAWAKAGQADKAAERLKNLAAAGYPIHCSAYTTVMVAYARSGKPSLADKWLRRLVDAGLTPDRHCYHAVI